MKTSLLFRSRAAVRCGVVLALLCITFTQGHSQALLQWEQSNSPYGGDVRCFLSTNNTLFAGTSGNGIYLSRDNGITWSAINTGLTELYISAIGNIGTTLFAGTWNNGVFRSTDNGLNWSSLNNKSQPIPYVKAFAVIGTTLFAASAYSGIFRSLDNGTTWQEVNSGLTNKNINSLTVIGTTLFAGTRAGLYRSLDSGATWVAMNGLPDVNINSLTQLGSILFAATSYRVYRSTDNGETWNILGVVDYGILIQSLGIHKTTLFVTSDAQNGSAGIYRSTDSGRTWVQSGLKSRLVWSIGSGEATVFAGMWGGGIYRSSDNGRSWTQTNTGLRGAFIQSLAVNGTTIFAGLLGGGVYSSKDNGMSWSELGSVSAGLTNLNVRAIAQVGTKIFIGTWNGYSNNGIFTSIDNGATWTSVNTGFANLWCYTFFIQNGAIFAGTSAGLLRSTDNGITWKAINQNLGEVQAITTNGSVLIAVGTKGAYRSTDNGMTWTEANRGMPKSVIVSHGPDYGTFTTTSVYSVSAISTILFAGPSGCGVYRSTDNGLNWVPMNTSLGSIYSFLVSDKTIFAGGYNGVFRSSDNGLTWTSENAGLPLDNKSVGNLTMVGPTLFVSTANGIYRTPLSGTTAVQEQPAQSPILTQYPNPFTAQTTLEYDIPAPQHVRLALYSPLGQELMTLVDEWQQAGRHSVSADMSSFASGVYVARLQAGAVAQTVLLRLVR